MVVLFIGVSMIHTYAYGELSQLVSEYSVNQECYGVPILVHDPYAKSG